ncbi:MAG: c-type cytochrome [Sulfitobacter sp.]
MKFFAVTALGFALLSAPAFADGHATGDADAGEKVFNKCKACHMIQDADGNNIVKGGRTGPNLYGIYTRVAGSTDFKYGESLVQAGEAGLEWNEETFVKYVADPKKFLGEYNDDKRAKSKMSFKLKKEDESANVWAYLVSVGPEVEAKPAD